MRSHFPFFVDQERREPSVADDGDLEFPDLPVEDPVLAVTGSFPESNPFGRKFLSALLFLTMLLMMECRQTW